MKNTDPASKFHQITFLQPSTPAVVEGNTTVTYAQLHQQASNIAAYLKRNQYQRIAILLKNGANAYAAMFGALMANAEYCPLNCNAPIAKLDNIISTFQPDIIITAEETHSIRYENYIFVDQITKDSFSYKNNSNTTDTAYTIFTSGSTGTPKGVMIQRHALANYLDWIESKFPLSPGVRWSQHPNIGFDLSVLDIYGALCHGATLYPLMSEFDRLLPSLFIQKNKIEIWNSVPSVLALMHKSGKVTPEAFKSIKLITVCGEPLYQSLLEDLFASLPNITIQNTYGPTEATVSCTEISLTAKNFNDHCDITACFGSMISGMGYYLDGAIDDRNEGELILYGKQIAKGYLHNKSLSNDKFFTRLIENEIQSCYRTGDIVYLKNQQLFFKCRKDDICKIKGRLVDLNEIENLISERLKHRSFLCYDENELHLFIEKGDIAGVVALREELSSSLEAHELPDTLTTINSVPLSQNDKVDKQALLNILKSRKCH